MKIEDLTEIKFQIGKEGCWIEGDPDTYFFPFNRCAQP